MKLIDVRSTENSRADQAKSFGLICVSAVVIAAFGPYVHGLSAVMPSGLRTEQIVVYLVAAIVTARTIGIKRQGSTTFALAGLWSIVVLLALFGAIIPPVNHSGWPIGNPLAGLDNLFLPVAVLIIIHGLMSLGAPAEALLRRVGLLLVWAAGINVFLAILQWQGASFAIWWSSGHSESNAATAVLAASNGRYSGLLNHPAEAGVLYSMALLVGLFLWARGPAGLAVVSILLIIGGALTVSKVFLFVGVPLAGVALIRTHGPRISRLMVLSGAALLLFGAVKVLTLEVSFPGLEQFRRILPGSGSSVIEVVSGGRYGASATLAEVVNAVREGPLLFGFGAGGLEVAYDSGWVEILVMTGLVGTACTVALWIVMIRKWHGMTTGNHRRLLGYLILLLFFANFGIPALTANRVAIIAWMLIGLLVSVDKRKDAYEDQDTYITRLASDLHEAKTASRTARARVAVVWQ